MIINDNDRFRNFIPCFKITWYFIYICIYNFYDHHYYNMKHLCPPWAPSLYWMLWEAGSQDHSRDWHLLQVNILIPLRCEVRMRPPSAGFSTPLHYCSPLSIHCPPQYHYPLYIRRPTSSPLPPLSLSLPPISASFSCTIRAPSSKSPWPDLQQHWLLRNMIFWELICAQQSMDFSSDE